LFHVNTRRIKWKGFKKMDKKDRERKILLSCQKASGLAFTILTETETKQVFSKYTGENPDFVIQIGGRSIGVELFELNKTRSELAPAGCCNIPHAASKRPTEFVSLKDAETYLKNNLERGLLPQDDIEQVCLERISEKIKKLDLYVAQEIWLIGYANNICHQTGMVQNVIEDEIVKVLQTSVLSKINVPDRIKKIFLFETGTGTKDFIIDLTQATYKSYLVKARLPIQR